MLAALNLAAVVTGVATAGLITSAFALVLGILLSITGVEDGANIGLVVGIAIGFAAGGWVAGLKARHSERFHGSVTGLVIAFLVVIVARLGGSPASTGAVLWLAFLGIVVSGLFGWLAGRWKRARL